MRTSVKRTTMTQVAEHAGVTIGTVSHVINGTATISDETKARVLRSIKDLDYRPNAVAKSLRSKKNYSIGLLIPTLTNSFHSKVTSTFLDCAYEKGYNVQIHGYEYSLEREKYELSRLEALDVGIIVIFNGFGDEKEIANLIKRGIPVVLADRSTTLANVPYIQFDNTHVMGEIVKSASERGYKRIGFISESLNLTNLRDRFTAYKEALEEYGLSYNPDYVFLEEKLSLENVNNGFAFTKEILKNRSKDELPDIWIASSDLLAIGMMNAIREAGLRVPQDMGVIGFDNIDISKYVQPKLSTVEQNQILLGKRLMELVDQTYEGKDNPTSITLEQKLILRESV